MSVISLAVAKTHLNARTSINDAELQTMLNRAEAQVTRRIGPLVSTAVTDERHDGGSDKVILRRRWVISLTGITYSDGTTTTLGDFWLDTDTAIVYWNAGTTGRFTSGTRNVLVTYAAGFTTLPDDLIGGVVELARHLWETQKPNNQPRSPGFVDEPAVPGVHTIWPQRVMEALEPFFDPAASIG